MALYRALRSLTRGNGTIARDGIDRLAGLAEESVAKLEELGYVARVSPPPLAELPGWEARARLLLPPGIMDAGQFLECDGDRLAGYLGEDGETVRRLKEEIIRWLQPDREEGCCR
jgi:hypothetical protein